METRCGSRKAGEFSEGWYQPSIAEGWSPVMNALELRRLKRLTRTTHRVAPLFFSEVLSVFCRSKAANLNYDKHHPNSKPACSRRSARHFEAICSKNH